MAEAVGLKVVSLHRTSFCGISLRGLGQGDWAELDDKEMEHVLKALDAASSSSLAKQKDVDDSLE
jgi:16S rRNA U516 pseudouridylate synthase RsuA-like enzyme